MEAMILAAGLGTRLRPLTDETPKALIEVGGEPILAHVARRLVDAGADRLVINVHHHADRIRRYVEAQDGFGAEVRFSVEPEQPLETGGGLLKAAPLFARKAPFFLHNADILTDLDLRALYDAHAASDALATLAVRPLASDRYLVFDAEGLLCGYGNRADGAERLVREPAGQPERLDFCGVQVVSPGLLGRITETGVFSIMTTYFRLIREGARIAAHRADDASWIDIGTPERLEEARRWFEDRA